MFSPADRPDTRWRSVPRLAGLWLLLGLLLQASLIRAAAPEEGLGEYLLDAWQTDKGLPQNTVSALCQTRDGYLWIGTLNGLTRFDGVRFHTFTDEVFTASLRKRIRCLYEDKNDVLWIGTEGGLIRHAHGHFERFDRTNGLAGDHILTLAEDPQGTLWAGTLTGISQWTGKAWVSSGAHEFFTLGTRPVHSLVWDHSGRAWIAADKTIYHGQSNQITTYLSGTLFPQSSFRSLEDDQEGSIWIGQAGPGLLRLREGKITAFDPSNGAGNGQIQMLYRAPNSDLWVGTERGLGRWRNGKWTMFNARDGLPNQAIRALTVDRENNLWIGTDGGGLIRLKPRQVFSFNNRHGLPEMILPLLEGPTGNILAGANGGGLHQGRDGHFTPFSESTLLPPNSSVWSLLTGRDGGLWIGTFGDGLFRCHEGQTLHYRPRSDLPISRVLALHEDRAGRLWVGTFHGLFQMSKEGQFTAIPLQKSIEQAPVTSILEDRNEVLWVGQNSGGLSRLVNGQVENFAQAEGLRSDHIRTLFEDREGRLWIGTGGGGLVCREGERFRPISTAEGLPDNVISQILQDDEGDLWLGSNRGILRLSALELAEFSRGQRTNFNVITYGREEGMSTLECTGGFQPAGLKTRDGRLWFSTVRGIVMVNPRTTAINRRPPPIAIESVTLDGKLVNREHLYGLTKESLSVPPRVRRLEFHFAGLSLVAPEKMKFRYQLEGFDPDWVDAGESRHALYTAVPPGDYTFRVVACNNHGIWNAAGAGFAFTVVPPFWQTWWFAGITALAVTGIVALGVRHIMLRRLRLRLKSLEQEHAIEKERRRIAQDMHDEIGAKLTRISFLSEMARRDLHEAEQAEMQIEEVSQTAREVIRSVDEIVWAVNPANDTLSHLAHYLCRHAETFFEMTPVRCQFDIPAVIPEIHLSTEIRHDLFLAAQEAMNNVLKHSGATEMSLRLTLSAQVLEIRITDNGHGLTLDRDHESAAGHVQILTRTHRQGNGLLNMRRRIENLSGTFTVNSQPGRGTEIIFQVPLPGK